jgi:hypothetical protein
MAREFILAHAVWKTRPKAHEQSRDPAHR